MRLILFLVYVCGAAANEVEQGAYLVRIAGCADCHTARLDQPMAGGYRLKTPFGDFFTPNITPANKTGIGPWSEAQFQYALRFGIKPNGAHYYPAFPYRSFTKITNHDLHNIYLYLRTLTPIENQNQEHRLDFPFGQRWLMIFWQWLFFSGRKATVEESIKDGVGPFVPDTQKSVRWNRGAYLAEALAHCAECHTPRNSLGHPITSEWMAGTADVLDGPTIPNITPDQETGLGRWTFNDWKQFLSSGFTPDYRTPSHEMAAVIRNTSALTKLDREALIDYLMSLKAVHHELN